MVSKHSQALKEPTQEHFVSLELSDCKVPIGCPWGVDCPEDAFPDHWNDVIVEARQNNQST